MGMTGAGQGTATLTTAARTYDMGESLLVGRVAFRRVRRVHVQATGTFGASATINLEYTLDNSTWLAVKDTNGAAVTLTAAGGSQVLENAFGPVDDIRFRLSNGDGSTSVVITANYSTGD